MKVGRLLIVISLGLGWACASSKRAQPPEIIASAGGQGTDVSEPGSASGRFGASECRACQAEACAGVEADCQSEPACAAFLTCLDACPESDAGGVEAECARACQPPKSADTAVLARAVTGCRATGYGAGCGCGPSPDAPALLSQACEPSADPDGCIKCRSERCCESREACLADDECLAYFSCVRSCDPPAASCELVCGQQHPEGWTTAALLLGCSTVLCPLASECTFKDPTPCAACGHLHCASATVDYFSSTAGRRDSICGSTCPGADCLEACSEPNPEGRALREQYLTCLTSRCLSECSD
jgi:hypothetical protein